MNARELQKAIEGASGFERGQALILQGYRMALEEARKRAVKMDLCGKGTALVLASELDYLAKEAKKCGV